MFQLMQQRRRQPPPPAKPVGPPPPPPADPSESVDRYDAIAETTRPSSFDLLAGGDVGDEHLDLVEFVGEGMQPILAPGDDDGRHALSREPAGQHLADPGRGAGHEGGRERQVGHRASVPSAPGADSRARPVAQAVAVGTR